MAEETAVKFNPDGKVVFCEKDDPDYVGVPQMWDANVKFINPLEAEIVFTRPVNCQPVEINNTRPRPFAIANPPAEDEQPE